MSSGGAHARGNASARSARSSRPSRRERDGLAALALGAAVAIFAAAALASRRIGASEAVAASSLTMLVAGLFASFVVRRLRGAGTALGRAVGWGIVLLLASATPTLVSIFPGRTVAVGELRNVGDRVPLPPAIKGRVRILVSATMPERSLVAFSLGGAGSIIEATLTRGVQWWGSGEERRHFHEERSSVLLDGNVPTQGSALALVRIAGDPVSLRVRIFEPFAPEWLAPLLAAMVMIAFGLEHGSGRREQAAVTAASVSGCAGVWGGLIATPDAAIGAIVGGAIVGVLTGVPLAALLRVAGRPLARAVARHRAGAPRTREPRSA